MHSIRFKSMCVAYMLIVSCVRTDNARIYLTMPALSSMDALHGSHLFKSLGEKLDK